MPVFSGTVYTAYLCHNSCGLLCKCKADMLQARGLELDDGAESLGQVWQRAQSCWQHVIQVSTGNPCFIVL